MKNLISIIIPARKEHYLDKTIFDIQEKAQGNVEIIIILDGHDAERINGVKYIYNEMPKGMRTAINQGVELAKGKYIMKLDAHCMLEEGFDIKLVNEHHNNWVQIPRRKRLNAEKWELIYDGRPDTDYMRMCRDYRGVINFAKSRDKKLKKILIDDIESFQGSCYFIEREYFYKLGLLDDKNFDWNGHEAQEITFKVWHDGGRVVRNKKTWYAHYHKPKVNFRKQKKKSREYIKVLAKKYGYEKNQGS